MAQDERGAEPRSMGAHPDFGNHLHTATYQKEDNPQAAYTAAVG